MWNNFERNSISLVPRSTKYGKYAKNKCYSWAAAYNVCLVRTNVPSLFNLQHTCSFDTRGIMTSYYVTMSIVTWYIWNFMKLHADVLVLRLSHHFFCHFILIYLKPTTIIIICRYILFLLLHLSFTLFSFFFDKSCLVNPWWTKGTIMLPL